METLMFIIIVGCGTVGAALAQRLAGKGHEVTVIGQSPAEFKNLPPNFRGRKVEGDVLTEEVLYRAEIQKADGLVATTRSESLNAVIAHVAKSIYNIQNVVVRNHDPSWQPMHEALGYAVVSSAGWDMQRIEEFLTTPNGDMQPPGSHRKTTVFEIAIPEVWSGQQIMELFSGEIIQVVGLQRDGHPVLPVDTTILAAGDLIYVKTDHQTIADLQKRLYSVLEK
jgi:trk system potassium uptake protein TrkA